MTGQSAGSKHFVMLLNARGTSLDAKYQQRESTLGHPPGREVVKQLVAILFDEHSCPLVVKLCQFGYYMPHRLVKHKKKRLVQENYKIFILSYLFTYLLVSEFQEVFVFLQLLPVPDEILRDVLISSLKSPYLQFSQMCE